MNSKATIRDIQARKDSPICDGDYRHALVHVAWYREGQERFLLFAMVELFPAELPAPDPTEEIALPVRSLGRQHAVYVRRFPMTAEDGLSWYESCTKGNVLAPWDSSIALAVGGLGQEPPWPHLVATNRLPFQTWGTVRAHHLIQTAPLNAAKLPLTKKETARWLSERLFFDLIEHGEWLGSINLVAPNPVLRNVFQTLAVDGDKEASDILLIPRSGQDIRGLTLHHGEHRHDGVAEYCTLEVDSTHYRIWHVGHTDKVSLAVTCPKRGVLEWHVPMNFIRTISIQAEIASGTKKVVIEKTKKGKEVSYTVPTSVPAFSDIIGDKDGEPSEATFLRQAELMRKRKLATEQAGQRLFYRDPEEAKQFVREIIGAARNKVWIVDPYFATAELFSFALATSRSEVDVKVITSAEHLKNTDKVDRRREAGDVLLDQLLALKNRQRLEVVVMLGKHAPIHDRLLVIDDVVWLSGNSLNDIGNRGGFLIRLPDPQQALDLIGDVETKPLSTWVKERQKVRKAEGQE